MPARLVGPLLEPEAHALAAGAGAPATRRGDSAAIRILVLRPVPSATGDEGPRRVPTPPLLLPSTSVDVAHLASAPASYESEADVVRGAPLVVARARRAEEEGYDAMLVACMLDPGVREARRVVRMPVLGLGAANLAVAQLLGERPARFFTTDIPVAELASDEASVLSQLLREGRRQIERYGADVLVPNCALLGRFAELLGSELGVPVLPNEEVGLKLAELFAALGVQRALAPPATVAQRLRRLANRWRWRCRHWIEAALSRWH